MRSRALVSPLCLLFVLFLGFFLLSCASSTKPDGAASRHMYFTQGVHNNVGCSPPSRRTGAPLDPNESDHEFDAMSGERGGYA